LGSRGKSKGTRAGNLVKLSVTVIQKQTQSVAMQAPAQRRGEIVGEEGKWKRASKKAR